jgi:predicted AAA+ superfamily ATPase
MFVDRIIAPRLKRLVGAFPAVAVVGARQVGKTTLLRHVLGESVDWVVFDPVQDVGGARSDPDLFLDNHPAPVILDEIQYAPEVVPALKRRIDRDRRPGQYFLTGSQQWQVLKHLSESLAGRVVFLDLEGFCLAERARAGSDAAWLPAWLDDPAGFALQRRPRLALGETPAGLLWRGTLPEATALPADVVPDYHRSYLRTYVERDVRLLTDVSDWQTFGRFFRLCAALSAQEINASQMGRDIGVTPQTARRWLDLLTGTFQWFEVPAWSSNSVKRVSSKPKGYMADTGLACHAQAISTPDALAGHPLWGPMFETFVVGEIRKQMALLSPPPKLHHWRSAGGAEVDLLIERDGRLHPIEVKAASRVGRSDTRGLQAFRAAHPGLDIAPGLVIAPCERVERLNETDFALPWDLAM